MNSPFDSPSPETATLSGFTSSSNHFCPSISLGGHSFGGTVAFEMACQLERAGHTVEFLLIMDTLTPDELKEMHRKHHTLGRRLQVHTRSLRSRGFDYIRERVATRLQKIFPFRLIQKFSQKKGIQPVGTIGNRILQASEKIEPINMKSARKYQPRKFSGKITLLRARPGRPLLDGVTLDALLGWGNWAESIDMRHVNGDHMSFLFYPTIVETTRIVRACLQAVTPNLPSSSLARQHASSSKKP
ncbi:MAG: thioesterase domain-containing protein [Geitlerinemataceae cyanobacterium]